MPEPHSGLSELTRREMIVLKQIMLGSSNKVCARHLNISHRTVEIHRTRILGKLGARNLQEFTCRFFQLDLTRLDRAVPAKTHGPRANRAFTGVLSTAYAKAGLNDAAWEAATRASLRHLQKTTEHRVPLRLVSAG